jgi:hypothetical protein
MLSSRLTHLSLLTLQDLEAPVDTPHAIGDL